MIRAYYVISRLSGLSLLAMSWGISLYLFRIEPLIPLLFAGLSLNTMAEYWKRLRLDKNPAFLKEEKYADWSIKIIGAGFVVNLSTGILATIFMTGFSPSYATALIVGIALALTGNVIAAASAISGRKKLGT